MKVAKELNGTLIKELEVTEQWVQENARWMKEHGYKVVEETKQETKEELESEDKNTETHEKSRRKSSGRTQVD